MYFKEKDAGTKWCPFTSFSMAGETPSNRYPGMEVTVETTGCKGHECAGWRWKDPSKTDNVCEGGCGLAYRPNGY